MADIESINKARNAVNLNNVYFIEIPNSDIYKRIIEFQKLNKHRYMYATEPNRKFVMLHNKIFHVPHDAVKPKLKEIDLTIGYPYKGKIQYVTKHGETITEIQHII